MMVLLNRVLPLCILAKMLMALANRIDCGGDRAARMGGNRREEMSGGCERIMNLFSENKTVSAKAKVR